MTGLALHVELDRLHTFIFVTVVAAEACHLAVHEASAPGHHAVLITVYIEVRDRLSRILPEEVEQFIAGLKTE